MYAQKPVIFKQNAIVGVPSGGATIHFKQEVSSMRRIAFLFLGLCLTAGMIGCSLFALPILMLGLDTQVLPLVLVAFVAGCGMEVFSIGWQTAYHEHIPNELLSRVKAMNGRMELETESGSGVSAYLEFDVTGLQKEVVYEPS